MATAFVTHEQDAAAHRADDDSIAVRTTIGPDDGFPALTQQVLECAPGRSRARRLTDGHETLYVLSGRGALILGERIEPLEPETGVTLAGGDEYALESSEDEPLRLIAVHIPGPTTRSAASENPQTVRRLADLATQPATTDRAFRVIADPESGLPSATHFVGYIPVARAPDHFHRYDEVIYLLEGEGCMHMEGEHTQLRAGSCIALPARTVHCLENVGEQPMRVVAVFRPGGSPAAAYYPDGTPAYG